MVKKIKRLLSLLLAFSVTMSMMSVSAFAQENDDPADETDTKTYTIVGFDTASWETTYTVANDIQKTAVMKLLPATVTAYVEEQVEETAVLSLLEVVPPEQPDVVDPTAPENGELVEDADGEGAIEYIPADENKDDAVIDPDDAVENVGGENADAPAIKDEAKDDTTEDIDTTEPDDSAGNKTDPEVSDNDTGLTEDEPGEDNGPADGNGSEPEDAIDENAGGNSEDEALSETLNFDDPNPDADAPASETPAQVTKEFPITWECTQTLPTKLTAGSTYEFTASLTSLTDEDGNVYELAEDAVMPTLTVVVDEAITITLSEDGTVMTVAGGVGEVTSTIMSKAVTTAQKKVVETIIVEGKVSGLGNSAFSTSFISLTKVSLSENVTNIGGYAFNKCTKLAEIDIPDSVVSIGDGAFSGCTALATVTGCENVRSIGSSSFSGCTALKDFDLPEGLTAIGPYGTFLNCTSLETVTIPDGVTSIGRSVFSGCTGLTTVQLPESVTSIDGYAFNKCVKLANIELPSKLTSLGTYAFYNCKALTEVNIPEGVTEIPDLAFYNCTGATFTGGENVTVVGKSAFLYCEAVKELPFLKNVTEMGDSAFAYTMLETATLNPELTSIPNSAFQGTVLTTIEIPEGVTYIGRSAFSSVPLTGDLHIPSSVEEIGAGAFNQNNQKLLECITIGDAERFSNLTTAGSGGTTTQPIFWSTNMSSVGENFNVIFYGAEGDVPTLDEQFSDQWKKDRITYVLGRLNADDDKISTEADAPTLQEAVNAAPDQEPTVIEISKSILLSDTVTIPAGKRITLTVAEGAENLFILPAHGEFSSDPADGTLATTMFDVEDGASLTLDGNIVYQARQTVASIIKSAGTLTLESGKLTNVSCISRSTAAVDITGGSFIMNGGTLSANSFSAGDSGTVRLERGAYMEMNGGEISGNTAYTSFAVIDIPVYSAGVLVQDGAEFVMNGGEISDNTGFRGVGVMLDGTYSGSGASMTMNGGTITGNTARNLSKAAGSTLDNTSYYAGGAGVMVQYNGAFELKNGTISDNTSAYVGGGVATMDQIKTAGLVKFEMTGGTICRNQAQSGGGVYSDSVNAAVLSAGHITGNTATSNGGGVYVSAQPYDILLKNAVIKDNTATTVGGGVWTCPMGAIAFAENSIAVYDNTAEAAGDDIATMGAKTSTVNGKMLGGGEVTWYRDGTVVLTTGDYGSYNSNGRYSEGDAQVISSSDFTGSKMLKAQATNAAKALAENEATLFITGNHAYRGGGVGANGNILTDDTEIKTTEITVNKVWSDAGHEDQRPDSVTVHLMVTINGAAQEYATAKLNAENGWSYTFTELPAGYAYSVVEEAVSKYITSYDGFTITNTYDPSATQLVEKVWDDAGHEGARPNSITVNLYKVNADGTQTLYQTATLNEENHWQFTFTISEDETYVVTEDSVAHYTVSYDGFVITNHYQPEQPEQPEKPDRPSGGGDNEDNDPTPPTNVPSSDVPSPDVPTSDAPEETPTTNIPNEDVPTTGPSVAEVPKTGDDCFLWVVLSVISGLGLGIMVLMEKKRKIETR